MSLKRAIALTTVCAAAALSVSVAFAAESEKHPKDTKPVHSFNQEIISLQHQIDELKAQQKAQKAEVEKKEAASKNYVLSPKCPDGKCAYHPSHLVIGTYFDKDDDNGPGGNLLVNNPAMRSEAFELRRMAQLEKEAAELGAPAPSYPRVTLGGQLEATIKKDSTDAEGVSGWDNSLSTALLVAYIQATPWVGGYFNISSDSGDKDRFSLARAYMTIGNLSKTPFFVTMGKSRLPFGQYSSDTGYMSPVTKVARATVTELTLGFQQLGDNAFHANVYAYEALSQVYKNAPVEGKPTTTESPHRWGAEAGYQFKAGDFGGTVGAGYISNIEDGQGFTGVGQMGPNGEKLPTHTWAKAVAGIDANASLSYKAFTLVGEYIQAASDFDATDLSFGGTMGGTDDAPVFTGKAAKPKMMHTELDYNFNTFGKPSFVGAAYGHTMQAVALGLPENRYSAFYGVSIWKHTLLTLEYDRDQHYDAKYKPDVQATGGSATDIAKLGKSENIIAAVFDFYF